MFGAAVTAFGGMVGLADVRRSPVGLDVLAVAGWHVYSGIGSDGELFGDPGASGEMPFVGLKGGATYRWGSKHVRFVLGGWLDLLVDTSQEQVGYQYGVGWFTPKTRSREVMVGGPQLGLALRLGVEGGG